MNNMKSIFENDNIQFARLLSEIEAVAPLDEFIEDLAVSMDLTVEDVQLIFSRADNAFARAKKHPRQVAEIGTVPVLLPDGVSLELALLCEVGTQNVFAVDASYVEQELDVDSPYGAGPLEWVDLPASPQNNKYSHTVVHFHVLSDKPGFDAGNWSVADLAREADHGDVVTHAHVAQQILITPQAMADKLLDFGSEPEFFEIDNHILRANAACCIECEAVEELNYESRDHGRQFVECYCCGAEWIEFSSPDDAKEQPEVLVVEVVKQGRPETSVA